MAKMHADEVDTDAALVRRLLADQFPDYADRRITRIEHPGTDNAIYRLGDDLCARLPRSGSRASSPRASIAGSPSLRRIFRSPSPSLSRSASPRMAIRTAGRSAPGSPATTQRPTASTISRRPRATSLHSSSPFARSTLPARRPPDLPAAACLSRRATATSATPSPACRARMASTPTQSHTHGTQHSPRPCTMAPPSGSMATSSPATSSPLMAPSAPSSTGVAWRRAIPQPSSASPGRCSPAKVAPRSASPSTSKRSVGARPRLGALIRDRPALLPPHEPRDHRHFSTHDRGSPRRRVAWLHAHASIARRINTPGRTRQPVSPDLAPASRTSFSASRIPIPAPTLTRDFPHPYLQTPTFLSRLKQGTDAESARARFSPLLRSHFEPILGQAAALAERPACRCS